MYEITRQKKIVVAILAFILSLMVGYAVFSESLNVKGTAKAEGDFALIFNSVNGIKESGSTGATADISPDKKTLTVTVPKLQYPTAYAEIDVTIKNIGTLNAYLKGIETVGLDTTDIKVTYSGIEQNDLIGVSQEKKMKIKVTWDEASTATSVDATFEIGLTYEQETSGRQTTTTTTKTIGTTSPSQPDTRDYFVWENDEKIIGISEEGEAYFSKSTSSVIEIPEGTTEIASGAIVMPYGYSEAINFDLLITVYEKIFNGGSFTDEEQAEVNKLNNLIEYTESSDRLANKTLVLPNSLRKIGSFNFFGLKLSGTLEIPNSVTEIGPYAFANAGFSDITISQNLERIEAGVFANIKDNTIEIPDMVSYIGVTAFSGMGLTGTLTIPDSVQEIGQGAFGGNNLTTVYLSSNTVYDSTSIFPSFDKGTNIEVR